MLVLNLPFKALMFLTLMRPSLVLFLVLWLKLVKDFLKVRCRLALLPFLISCLIWLDLVASLPLIKERILVIILLLHFLSLMLGSVLVLMLPLLVWLTPDLRIKKRLLKCNWTIRKRLPRCKMRLKKRLLAFSRRLHARIRKTRYMHKMRCLLINRRSLLLALRVLWKKPIFPSISRFPRLCAKCLHKLKRLVSILPMNKIGRAVQQVSEIMRQMLTQAQTAGQYFTNDQIKEMTRKVSAEVDLVHQQTQNQRYGSSHIGATAKDISNVVTDAASGVVDIFHGIDKAVADTWNNFWKDGKADGIGSNLSRK